MAIFESGGRFVLDSADQVKDLPTKNVVVGSIAVIADTSGTQYMFNNAHEWVAYKPGSGSGGGGDDDPDYVDGDETWVIRGEPDI